MQSDIKMKVKDNSKDYLLKRRQKRVLKDPNEGSHSMMQQAPSADWVKNFDNGRLSPEQRLEAVAQKASDMELHAKRQEKLLRANTNTDVADQGSVNQLYLESIKAKLAVIDHICESN